MCIHTCLHLGMLSKSKGQVLRVAATLHVLFYDATCIDDQEDITVSGFPSTISTKAILAAENFVDTCCQHAAFIAGRSKMADEITRLTSGKCDITYTGTQLKDPIQGCVVRYTSNFKPCSVHGMQLQLVIHRHWRVETLWFQYRNTGQREHWKQVVFYYSR